MRISVLLVVADLSRSVRFYEGLGWRLGVGQIGIVAAWTAGAITLASLTLRRRTT